MRTEYTPTCLYFFKKANPLVISKLAKNSKQNSFFLWVLSQMVYISTVINKTNKMITTDNISVGDYAADLVDPITEAESANQFTFYPQPPLKVKDLEMDIRDEYNGFVNIIMTNGDRIIMDLHETRVRQDANGAAPPWYSFSLTINGDLRTSDIDDVIKGGRNMVDDILNYYIKERF